MRIWPMILILCFSAIAPSYSAPEFTDLASDDYRERDAAQQKLMAWLKPRKEEGMLDLLGQYVNSRDPEVKKRLRGALAGMHRFLPKGFIGIRMADMRLGTESGGVTITQVLPGTPAEAAKLRQGDLILRVNETRLDMPQATSYFSTEIKSYFAGDEVNLKISRQGREMKMTLVLGKLPPVDERLQLFRQQGLLLRKEMLLENEKLQESEQFERWLERTSANLETKKSP